MAQASFGPRTSRPQVLRSGATGWAWYRIFKNMNQKCVTGTKKYIPSTAHCPEQAECIRKGGMVDKNCQCLLRTGWSMYISSLTIFPSIQSGTQIILEEKNSWVSSSLICSYFEKLFSYFSLHLFQLTTIPRAWTQSRPAIAKINWYRHNASAIVKKWARSVPKHAVIVASSKQGSNLALKVR